jgi:hypothetical protein
VLPVLYHAGRRSDRCVDRRFSRTPPPRCHGKLKGLADFAEEFGSDYVRIDAISKNDKGDLGADTKGALLLLDLKEREVRKAIRCVSRIRSAS